jgi:hypothetical protein
MKKLSILSLTLLAAGTTSCMESGQPNTVPPAAQSTPQTPRTSFLLEELEKGNAEIKGLLPAPESTEKLIAKHLDDALQDLLSGKSDGKVFLNAANRAKNGIKAPSDRERLLQHLAAHADHKGVLLSQAINAKKAVLTTRIAELKKAIEATHGNLKDAHAEATKAQLKLEADATVSRRNLDSKAIDRVWTNYYARATTIVEEVAKLEAAQFDLTKLKDFEEQQNIK